MSSRLSTLLLTLLILFSATASAQPELDRAFNSNGIKTFNLGPGSLADLAIQPDNKIVTAGSCRTIDLWIYAFCVGRLNTDGNLDPAFGGGSLRITVPGVDLAGNAGTGGIAVQPDGKIVLAGYATFSGRKRIVLARLETNGSLDTSFGTGGIVITDIDSSNDETAEDLLLQADGKIVIAGSLSPSGNEFLQFAARYTANGNLDSSFGTGGIFRAGLPGNSTKGNAVSIASDGKFVIGGSLRDLSTTSLSYLLTRLSPNGTPDPSWDGDGYKSIQYAPTSSGDFVGINSVAVQADGRVVALGYPNTLFRFNPDASADATFDVDGTRSSWPGVNHESHGIWVSPSGKITMTGNTVGPGSPSGSWYACTIAKFLPDGSPDASFSGDGYFVSERTNSGGIAVAVDSQGRTVVAGLASNSVVVYELPFFFVVRIRSFTDYRPFDFDGDGRADLSIFRPSNGQWWIDRSTLGTIAHTFGDPADTIAPGDFTGDGLIDIAVFRPSTGEWLVLRSNDYSYYSFPFGAAGDVVVPGDYDGDGVADPAVYRPSNSTWYIRRSSGGTTIETFGVAGDLPAVSDYDGDGIADIAIFRPASGQWWIRRSTGGFFAAVFGTSSDRVVPGDYTGDGKSDIAIFRPATGQWMILRSEDYSYFAFPFGISTDTPTPGDYDGDGRFDAAVFRSSASTWYVQRSTAGTLIQSFGAASDIAVPNAFVR